MPPLTSLEYLLYADFSSIHMFWLFQIIPSKISNLLRGVTLEFLKISHS